VLVVEQRDVGLLAGEGVEGGAPDEAQRALGGRDDEALGDLLEGDRQRLAGHRGDLGRDATLAVAQPVEVGVDLPGPRGTQGDQGELRAGAVEELLDPRVDHRVVAGCHGALLPRVGNRTA
jgi:hypothetical protein